jgi:hypothetical protein
VNWPDVSYTDTPNGLGAVIAPIQHIARVRPCGCWIIKLGQGNAFLPCGVHEPEITRIVGIVPTLIDPKEPKP